MDVVSTCCMYLDICLINPFILCLLPHVHMCLSSSLALGIWSYSFCKHISLSSVKQLWLTVPRKAAGDRCWTCLADWWLSIFIERLRGAGSLSLYLTVSLLLPPVAILGIRFCRCLLSIDIFLLALIFFLSVSSCACFHVMAVTCAKAPFMFILDLSASPCPPSFNGFLSTLWGWVGAGVSLFLFHMHSPGKECAVSLVD